MALVRLCVRWLVVSVGLSLAGCPEAATPSAPGLVDAGWDVGGVFDAGPPVRPALAFQLVMTTIDGGIARFDDGLDAGVTVAPVRALELTSQAGLSGVRVRLFDWADSVVASDDTLETSDAGFRYRIELVQPLKPGRGYSLLVDAETADQFADVFGGQHDPWRLPIRVAGEVEPEPGQPSKKTKKKRR